MLTPASPVTEISGIGPAKAAQLSRLGIATVRDLLFHVPRAYENRSQIRLLADGRDGAPASFLLTVATRPSTAQVRKDLSVTKFRAFDASGSVEVVFFNQDFLRTAFSVGEVFRFTGKLTYSMRVYQLASPKYEKFGDGDILPDFIPVYSTTEGLSQAHIIKALHHALAQALPCLADYLPEEIRQRHSLPTLSSALKELHEPTSAESISRAVRRLAFDEFFLFALGVAASKEQGVEQDAPPMKSVDPAPFLRLLPYSLTDAQKRVCNEMTRDMISGSPMRRILVGDVGCGKTVCAAFAIYVALKNGYQAALMAPTEILARQHYEDLLPIFSALGYRTALLLGSTTPASKRAIYRDLAAEDEGRIDLLIGTHALLSEKTQFSALGLTVTDEQHRFGVYQRAALKEKSAGSHFLVMSATPIPRTLALVLYGDLDISKIDEMPKGRQRVDTFVVDEGYRERLDAFIRKQVAEGGQVYIVCPAIEPSEADEANDEVALSAFGVLPKDAPPSLKSAAEVSERMRCAFPELRIGFLHGRMRAAEKDSTMSLFAAGELDVLVSTTVIEVGVNVPNASLMIVENAERFGLSQLHQLRGRVGRGSRRSYCVLVSDHKGSTARARLATMQSTYDGYAVAEQDLKQRGPGDFLASTGSDALRQSGGLSFRFASLCDDSDVLTLATAEAAALPIAELDQFPLLREELARVFRQNQAVLS